MMSVVGNGMWLTGKCDSGRARARCAMQLLITAIVYIALALALATIVLFGLARFEIVAMGHKSILSSFIQV
jgi:hypothetical protein